MAEIDFLLPIRCKEKIYWNTLRVYKKEKERHLELYQVHALIKRVRKLKSCLNFLK